MQSEWLILADAAQVNNGKLYIMGGGWDVLTVNQTFPVTQYLGLAASFKIPWSETNQKHEIEVRIVTEDEGELAKIAAQLEVGRPAGIPVGTDQRAQFAANLPISFEKPGLFAIVTKIEGQESARTTFRVIGGLRVQMPPPSVEPT
jgi:hypothetical protein